MSLEIKHNQLWLCLFFWAEIIFAHKDEGREFCQYNTNLIHSALPLTHLRTPGFEGFCLRHVVRPALGAGLEAERGLVEALARPPAVAVDEAVLIVAAPRAGAAATAVDVGLRAVLDAVVAGGRGAGAAGAGGVAGADAALAVGVDEAALAGGACLAEHLRVRHRVAAVDVGLVAVGDSVVAGGGGADAVLAGGLPGAHAAGAVGVLGALVPRVAGAVRGAHEEREADDDGDGDEALLDVHCRFLQRSLARL